MFKQELFAARAAAIVATIALACVSAPVNAQEQQPSLDDLEQRGYVRRVPDPDDLPSGIHANCG